MTHIYLTEEMIKDALKAHTITKREAEELVRVLKRCQREKKTSRQVQQAS